MLVVGLNGSPNRDGETAGLLKAVLEVVKSKGAHTELVYLAEVLERQDKPYCDACSSPCDASCSEGNELGEVFELLKKADALVLGSPVYFGTVSAQMKAFWDKTRCLRTEKALVGKVGGAVSVGAARFGGQETTVRALHDIMLVHGMKIVGDGSVSFDAGHQGVCGQKPVCEDQEALRRAEVMGHRLCEEIKS